MPPNERVNEHLLAEDVAAYLDRRLDADQMARADSHFAECSECRAELVELRTVLAEPAVAAGDTAIRPIGRRRLRWPIGAGLAAAAVLLIAFATTLRGPTPTVERGDATGGDTERLATHSPTDGARSDSVVFVWSPAAPEASYRVTVTDPSGAPVWSASTADTVIRLPQTHVLQGGQHYHWYVDALLNDTRTRTSGVRSFVTAP